MIGTNFTAIAIRELHPNVGFAITTDGGIVWETGDAPVGYTDAAVASKAAEFEAAEPMRQLREERDRLIAETDWWVLPDRTPTDAQLAYRQALRDITNTYSSLEDVVWPEKP